MRNTLLLNPLDYINDIVYEEKERELNIAVEIFLTQSCSRIHYADLMDDVDPSLASKQRLISWLNDHVRNGMTKRKGVISLYREERREHFRGNAWMPLYFPQFIQFAKTKLTDKNYVKDAELVRRFRKSFADPGWLAKASAVMGLKLLESLHEKGMLNSVVAKSLLDLNKNNRILLEKNAKLIGKVAKNQELDAGLLDEIKANFEEFFKRQWEIELQKFSGHEEYRILQKYEEDIRNTIFSLSQREPVLMLNHSAG